MFILPNNFTHFYYLTHLIVNTGKVYVQEKIVYYFLLREIQGVPTENFIINFPLLFIGLNLLQFFKLVFIFKIQQKTFKNKIEVVNG